MNDSNATKSRQNLPHDLISGNQSSARKQNNVKGCLAWPNQWNDRDFPIWGTFSKVV